VSANNERQWSRATRCSPRSPGDRSARSVVLDRYEVNAVNGGTELRSGGLRRAVRKGGGGPPAAVGAHTDTGSLGARYVKRAQTNLIVKRGRSISTSPPPAANLLVLIWSHGAWSAAQTWPVSSRETRVPGRTPSVETASGRVAPLNLSAAFRTLLETQFYRRHSYRACGQGITARCEISYASTRSPSDMS